VQFFAKFVMPEIMPPKHQATLGKIGTKHHPPIRPTICHPIDNLEGVVKGNLDGMAGSYFQLGNLAEAQRDFESTRKWYIESLAITEKQDNLHRAAMTYHHLGWSLKRKTTSRRHRSGI
jgi:hypothetical protein